MWRRWERKCPPPRKAFSFNRWAHGRCASHTFDAFWRRIRYPRSTLRIVHSRRLRVDRPPAGIYLVRTIYLFLERIIIPSFADDKRDQERSIGRASKNKTLHRERLANLEESRNRVSLTFQREFAPIFVSRVPVSLDGNGRISRPRRLIDPQVESVSCHAIKKKLVTGSISNKKKKKKRNETKKYIRAATLWTSRPLTLSFSFYNIFLADRGADLVDHRVERNRTATV